MGEIVRFSGKTTLELDPQQVLQAAAGDEGWEEVVVVGYRDGHIDVRISGDDWAPIYFLLDRVKRQILDEVEDG